MGSTSKEQLKGIEAHYTSSRNLFKQWGGITEAEAYPLHTGFYSRPGFVQEDDGSQKMTTKVISLCAIQSDQRVLDAGCGVGNLAFEIAKRYTRNNVSVHGIDVARINLDQANAFNQKGNFSNTSFSRQDYLNTAFKDNTFDRIVFFESLAHSQNYSGVLREASRLLKPKGKIILVDMFTKGTLDEDQKYTMNEFMSLSSISGFAEISSVYEYLTSLNFQVNVTDITHNVLLPDDSERFDDVEVAKISHDNSDEGSKRLQDLLLKIQQIMRSGKTGYYFIVATKK